MRPAIGLIASTALVGTLAGLAGIAHAAPAPLKVKSVEFTATPAPANRFELVNPREKFETVIAGEKIPAFLQT